MHNTQVNFFSVFPICCLLPISCIRLNFPSILLHPLLKQSLSALSHTLVHESEEADRASADAHAVDEAAGEEGTEDSAEVGVRDL